jgi:hypothetical protein
VTNPHTPTRATRPDTPSRGLLRHPDRVPQLLQHDAGRTASNGSFRYSLMKPAFVRREFEAYLRYKTLAAGKVAKGEHSATTIVAYRPASPSLVARAFERISGWLGGSVAPAEA